MDRFEYYKERYYNEEEIKRSLNSALNFPIGFGSSLVALAYYLLVNSDHFQNYILKVSFIALLAIGSLYVVFSFFWFFLSWTKPFGGHQYAYWPDAEKTEDYYMELINVSPSTTLAGEKFEEQILKKCVKAININFTLNTKRKKLLYRGKWALFFGMALMISASLVWIVGNFPNSDSKKEIEKIHKVEIVKSH